MRNAMQKLIIWLSQFLAPCYSATIHWRKVVSAIIRFLIRSGTSVHNPFHPARSYVRPKQGDGARDYFRVSSDMRRISDDLRKVTKRELSNYGG